MTDTPLPMPDEIELGRFYIGAPMSENFYHVMDKETKGVPVAKAFYRRVTAPCAPQEPEIEGLQEAISYWTDNKRHEFYAYVSPLMKAAKRELARYGRG